MPTARLITIPPQSRVQQVHHGRRDTTSISESPVIPQDPWGRPQPRIVEPALLPPPIEEAENDWASTRRRPRNTEIKRKRVPTRNPSNRDSAVEQLRRLEEDLEHVRVRQPQGVSRLRTSSYIEDPPASLRLPRSRYSRPELLPRPLTAKKGDLDEEGTIQFSVSEVTSSIFELRSPTGSVATTRRTRSSLAPSVSARSARSIRSFYSRKGDPEPPLPEPPVPAWPWSPEPVPRRPGLGTWHDTHSSPELSQVSRRTTMRTLTPSQIFDPSFQLFGKPSFERLSFAFAHDRRASRMALAEFAVSPTDSEATLGSFYEQPRPRTATFGSTQTGEETLHEGPQEQKTLASIIQELKESLKWGTHAPCTTPNGKPSPLPLCARPEGVDEFLMKVKNRGRRIWRWRFKGRRKQEELYFVQP